MFKASKQEAFMLKKKELRDVVAYLSSLKPVKRGGAKKPSGHPDK